MFKVYSQLNGFNVFYAKNNYINEKNPPLKYNIHNIYVNHDNVEKI